MRWVVALLISVAWVLGPRAEASAQPAPDADQEGGTSSDPSVTRASGADSCPDSEALRLHVARLRGHQATSELSAYRVHFSYDAGTFRADIRVGEGGDARVLRDRAANCASLEQATALTLALLLDSELPSKEAAPPLVVTPAPPTERSRPQAANLEDAAHFAFSLGGGALFGVTQLAAPTVQAELGIGVNRFRTGLGVLWVPTQRHDFGPGRLREQLLTGTARACFAALRSSRSRFDLCSGFYAGVLKVDASGYTRNGSVDEGWLAIPLGVSLTTTWAPLGLELATSALIPLRRHDFSIDNLGVAYASWPIALLLSVRAFGAWLP